MHFRCVKVSNLTSYCSEHTLAVNNYLVNYEEIFSYEIINGEIYRNELEIENFRNRITDHKCVEESLLTLCNAFYIPCDMTTGKPRSLCVDSCKRLREDCAIFFYLIVRAVELSYDLPAQSLDFCADTMIAFKLEFKQYFNNTNITTARGVESNCYHVQGKWILCAYIFYSTILINYSRN